MSRWLSLAFACVATSGAIPPERGHVHVPMRDGVQLDTNVFRPPGALKVPTILIRTPYGKGTDLPASYAPFVDRGYAVVIQDVRGRYGSEGVFSPLTQEGPDGYDTLSWIARQGWSNGRIGMMGGSYQGIAQWKAALLNHPNLKAIFPVVSGSDDYFDRFYSPGGAMKLGHRLLWLAENLRAPGFIQPNFQQFVEHLPLRSSDRAATGKAVALYQEAVDHPVYDSFWKNLSVLAKLDRVRIPVFAVGGWYDNYVESDLAAFSELSRNRARGTAPHRILIGPWAHNMSVRFPGVDFGSDSSAPIRAYQFEWFDHWLKGSPEGLKRSPEGLKGLPEALHRHSGGWHEARSEVADAPVEIFVMGVNRWRDEREWPLARTRFTPVFLAGKGHANGLQGDGALEWEAPRRTKTDSFIYDPTHPVPTMGGAVCCNPRIFPWGPMDQRPVEARDDVLIYTSKPLRRDLEVTGPVKVFLYVSTSAADTDFTVKLVDVFPNGEARNLTDGMLRLRYRQGVERAMPATPGELYPVSIDAGVTSNVFLAGHKIRLEVSSSNFPRFDRNPNSGRLVADETALRKARQLVRHGRRFASHILLPVIPESTSYIVPRYSQTASPSDKTFRAR